MHATCSISIFRQISLVTGYLDVSQREPKVKIAFCFLRSVTNRRLGLKTHASLKCVPPCDRPCLLSLRMRMIRAHGKKMVDYFKRRPWKEARIL